MVQRILRERELVARGRPPFCVLLFEVGDPGLDPRPCRTLIRVLRRRLRVADATGWLTRGCVAVLLSATDRDGALALAADVERLLAQAGTAVPCTLDSDLFAGGVLPEGTGPSSEP
jgi:hypothetical protein